MSGSNIDFRKLSTLVIDGFLRKLAKWALFPETWLIIANVESKRKLSLYTGYNIMELYNVLVWVWFMKKESELAILSNKLYVQVAPY